MNATASPFSLVVGLDFHDPGGYAFDQAGRIARAIPGSRIHLVHVSETPIDGPARTHLLGQLRIYANEKAASLGGLVGVRVGIHLRAGDPAGELLQLANDINANMIVLGAHERPDVKSWFVGSVAHRVLHKATCPVLIAGPPPAPAHHAPTVEPPCLDCERTRADSKRNAWWCERHAPHGVHAHVFSYVRELPLTEHDSEVIPTGIDF